MKWIRSKIKAILVWLFVGGTVFAAGVIPLVSDGKCSEKLDADCTLERNVMTEEIRDIPADAKSISVGLERKSWPVAADDMVSIKIDLLIDGKWVNGVGGITSNGGIVTDEDTGREITEAGITIEPMPRGATQSRVRVSSTEELSTGLRVSMERPPLLARLKDHLIPTAYAALALSSGQATTSATFSAATSVTINRPTGCAQNDVAVASWGHGGNTGGFISDFNGFTSVEQHAPTGVAHEAGYKLIGAGEAASYTWQHGGVARNGGAGIVCLNGNDTTTPFDLDGVEAGSANPHVTAAITPSQANSMIIGFIYRDPAGLCTGTANAGFTHIVNLGLADQITTVLAYKVQGAAANEGVSITPSCEATSEWGEYTLAIKPAVGGGGGNGTSNGYQLFFE